jgi:uncharacterized protein YdhG (YjbR/CyaY superfamily)
MNTEYKNIDEYIASQPDQIGRTLEHLRLVIKKAAPEAEEVISYQMPAFKYYGMLCFFAAFKAHYSLFVSPEILNVFRDKLKSYQLSKSAIRIPIKAAVPDEIVTEIIKHAVTVNLKKEAFRQAKKKKR